MENWYHFRSWIYDNAAKKPAEDEYSNTKAKGCLYVCGVKFETPIDEMRTSLNAGDNIICPHEVAVPRELDGGHSLVKIIIPAKLKMQ